jgi:hypothetical protein
MRHIEFNLITADPARLGKAVTFIEAELRPAVEKRPGSLGMALCAKPGTRRGDAPIGVGDRGFPADEQGRGRAGPRGGRTARRGNDQRGGVTGRPSSSWRGR